MLSPFATGSTNSTRKPPSSSQPLYAHPLDSPFKSEFSSNPSAYPALTSRAAKLLGGEGPNIQRNLQSLEAGSALNTGYSGLPGARLPDYRLMSASSALSAADLQFSGYILNGSGGDAHRSSLSHTGAPGNAAAPYDTNAHLLETLGVTGAQPFATQGLSGRDGMAAVSTYGQTLGAAGTANSSMTSTPYQGMPTAGTMPLMEYNSYASLLNKANLLFDNNLDSMTVDWSLEERECRRRLVQFWRRHENNNILCTFKGVAAADRVPNSIVVSCIYWEDKQDFFITSVDCIYLLESLIAVRFTVEEKNRIRRNLEGFRPLTVSKCKAESADFFKLIMSFPNPKPRNIEKDVKVFPWRILPLALKKIIGKYTASYSSTASAGLDAFPASRASGGQPLAGVTLSAPAGGMMAFSPHAQPTGLLDGSSASASVVAAAAAARSGSTSERAGAHLFTPSPASGSSSLTSSSANLTTLLEAQAAKLDPSSAGISSAYMTPVTAGMCLGFDIGAQLPIGVDTSHAVSSALNSVMADFGQLTSPVAAHRDFGQTIAPAHLQNHSFGADNECQGSASSSTAALTSGHSTQLGLAGMVMDSSQPLLGSGLPGETTASFPGSSIFEQLAASCGFPALSYGQPISERVENNGGAKSQRVVRGASSKRPAQHAPYSVNRSERQKLCSTSSDCGAKGLARPGTPARVGTSLSSSCDRPGERGASPSIPLILEQQTTRTADTAARPPLLFDSNPAASAVEQSQSLTQLANEFTNTKAASVPFRDLLQKPAEDKLYLSCVSGGDGDRAPASDSTSASILGLEMGSDIASSDFNFLADLFRMPGASQSDCSLDSVTVGSASPTHGSAAPEMGARLAQTDSGGDPTAAAVSAVLSPSTVLAKSAPQFVPGLQPSGASPKLFGGALFGDVTILTRPSEG